MSYVKYTKTSTFIFPLLEIPKLLFKCDVKSTGDKLIMTTRFLNSYLFDRDLNNQVYNEGPYIFIVIKSYQDKLFDTFHSDLIELSNYVDEYMKNDYLVTIFKIRDKYLDDYELIKQGKYSEISKDVKTMITNNNYFTGKPYIVPLILCKADELKESWERRLSIDEPELSTTSLVNLDGQEVWGVLDEEKENLTKEVLLECTYSNKLKSSKIKAL